MATAEKKTLGQKIRDARAKSGRSQEHFAPLIGTSRRHLIRIEKGQHRPRPEMLARISEATGVPVSEFESSDDDEESDMPSSADLFEALVRRLKVELREELRA